MDWNYLLIVLGILFIPLIAQLYVSFTYRKYLKVENKKEISGFEAARNILDSHLLKDIHIVQTRGTMSDHYEPRRNVIRLSEDVFDKNTISGVAIAAHECGHALQKKDGYFPMKVRNFLVPIVNLSNKFAYIILIVGFILQYYNLVTLAIILMSSSVLFQLITLPVEFNASKRAKKEISKLKLLNKEELDGSSKVLTAAALTYVAGLLATMLELLRLIAIVGNRRD